MKLNHDCIRDVLLYLEDQDYYVASAVHIVDYNPVDIRQIAEALSSYSLQDIYYTLSNLAQAGYIDAIADGPHCGVSYYQVKQITFKGHEFLAHIKDAERWSAVKKVLGAVKDYSLATVGAIAQGATSALVETYIKSKG